MADTSTSASRRASPTSPGRLPSARERRPALAALAVLLIVGGAFASGYLALQAGNRTDYLRVRADVPQGAEITGDDLENVSLPEDLDGAISSDHRRDVVGLRTVTHLLPGTILTPDMVTDESAIQPGEQQVSFGLDVSNIDSDLEPGAAVVVYAVNRNSDHAEPYDATLVSAEYPDGGGGIGGGSSSSDVRVRVRMDSSDAAAIQSAILDDRVSVAETAPPDGSDKSSGGE